MQMTTIKLKLVGTRPLIMHNGRLADPLDEYTRALKPYTDKKQNKTEADHEEIARIEWWGGLYTDETNTKIVMPADNILAVGLKGAKKKSKGPKFEAGVMETASYYPFTYDGPQDINKLFEDKRFIYRKMVKVKQNRVVRTRPIFGKWDVTVELLCDVTVCDPGLVVTAYEDAGQMVGLCERGPRFGRYIVEVLGGVSKKKQ